MVKIIGVMLSLCLASCSLMALQEPEVSISDVKVVAIVSDDEVEFCRGFTLTRAQVESYFERAEEISFRELHDEFDYLPCAVKGAVRRESELCEFLIRAGATAEVSCQSNQHFFYGCRSCDDLFRAHP